MARTLRPEVPVVHVNEVEHRRQLAVKANAALSKDGTDGMTAPLKQKSFAAADLVGDIAASLWEGATVFNSDDAAPAFSDGSTWKSLAPASDVADVAADLAALTALTTPVAWIIVAKTSDEARNNAGTGATLTADAALAFSVAANTKYRFRISVHYATAATPDFKFDLNGPAAPTAISYVWAFDINDDVHDRQVATAFNSVIVVASTGTAGVVVIDGILQNGTNAGTFQFRWAQNTANASNTTVRAGSFIEYQTV